MFQLRKCCHARSCKLRPAVLRPHHTHTSHITHHLLPTSSARHRRSFEPICASQSHSDAVPPRSSCVCCFLKRHKFASLFAKNEEWMTGHAAIDSICFIQTSVLQLLSLYIGRKCVARLSSCSQKIFNHVW